MRERHGDRVARSSGRRAPRGDLAVGAELDRARAAGTRARATISGSVRSEVSVIHAYGPSQSRADGDAARPVRAAAGGARVAALDHARPPRATRRKTPELQAGEREEQREEDDGERARAADAEVDEDLLVDGVDEDGRRLDGPALGHHAHHVERLEAEDEAGGARRRPRSGGGAAT